MSEPEYRELIGVIDAFLRNEPHRFREATAWVRAHRTVPTDDETYEPRRYGYVGYSLRTFECMWGLAQLYRSHLHDPSPPSLDDGSSAATRAFRTLLIAWLLNKRSALASADKKTRPTGCGPLPLLDAEQVRRIERKHRLAGSKRWRAFVHDALLLVGGGDYAPASSPAAPAAGPSTLVAAEAPSPLRKPKRCEMLALYTHLQAISADPSTLGKAKTPYTRAQHDHVKLHGSSAYGRNAKLPEYGTWARYVRLCLAYFERTLGSTPSLADVGRLLRLDDS